MKRLGQIWSQVVSFENLLLAYRKAARGKKRSEDVARFALNLEKELFSLQRALLSGAYHPGAYRLFKIYERKPRIIAAAPFRDRVVQHAMMNLIEPALDKQFIFDSYACRKGKGVHRAVARYQGWARRYAYVLKMDVQQYFPSIDHVLLKNKLRRRIKDPNVLRLLELIIDTGPCSPRFNGYYSGDDLLTPLYRPAGIPIGNLTSQFFANLFLDELDHYLKQSLRHRAYLRYVDDMVVLGDDKVCLRDTRDAVRQFLDQQRLRLHPCKLHISPTALGLDLFGYRVYPYRRQLRNENGFRFARRLRGFTRGYHAGRLEWHDFNPGVQSWIGHAMHADTQGLRRAIFADAVFVKGSGHTMASA